MIDPESKRKGIETLVKLGVFGVGLAVAGPYIWMSLEGLVALAALGGTMLTLWAVAPALGTFAANWRIKALIAVIEANPIETMKNLYGEKLDDLDSAASNIRDFEQELYNFTTEVKKVRDELGGDEVAEYTEAQEKMRELLGSMKAEQTTATGELKAFQTQIRKAEMLFNLAKAANKMLEKSTSAQNAVFADIKQKVSFDKVRSDLNRAFANMNSVIDRRHNATMFAQPKPKEMTIAQQSDVIDLSKAGKSVKIMGTRV